MERNCGDCALKALQGGMCPVFKANMEGEQGCPYFASELKVCEVCGGVIPKGGTLIEDEGSYHLVCQNCATGTPCNYCASKSDCRLQNDKSCTEPLYVMVQHRQGNAVLQSQQLNPKRVQATCAQGCKCFREDGLDDGTFCWKLHSDCGCNNNKPKWRN